MTPTVNNAAAPQFYSPPSGFVAVNSHRRAPVETLAADENPSSPLLFSNSNADNITIINGTSIRGASPTTRTELLKKFFTTADRQTRGYEEIPNSTHNSRPSSSRTRLRVSDIADHFGNTGMAGGGTPSVAIPHTPTLLLPPPKSNYEKDNGGPFKPDMIGRMEELRRGDRILPPCDRCRRLQMDCLKNLTACMGCTRKHAKCSWKDVKMEELFETPVTGARAETGAGTGNNHHRNLENDPAAGPAPEDRTLRDAPNLASSVLPPVQVGLSQGHEGHEGHQPEQEREVAAAPTAAAEVTAAAPPPSENQGIRGDSAPSVTRPSEREAMRSSASSHRRAVSETRSAPDRRLSGGRNENASSTDEDSLIQAIMDTVQKARTRGEGEVNDKEYDQNLVKACL